MALLILAVGLVLAVEGLVLALAPSRLDAAFDWFRAQPADRRRMLGLGALAAGVVLIWLARSLGA
nr:DUF2065 domain-containing protein [Frigidibacter mobilis]